MSLFFDRASCAATVCLRATLRVLLGLALLLPLRAHAQAQLVVRSSPQLAYPAGERAVADLTVVLEIGETGAVTRAEVKARSPEALASAFDEAALAFARGLVFEPIVVEGVAQRLSTEITLHFEPPATGASGPVPEPHAHEEPPTPAPDPAVPAPPAPPRRASFSQRVRGARTAAAPSDFHLHVGHLADVPRSGSAELITLAPGVLLTNHGGEGHAPAVFLRGFDAGEGQDLEFRLDGVPLNDVSNAHSHGYADVHFIIPELVDELRVVEGPFDPRQGDFGVAGSAEYHLGLHERGLHAKASYGSFGTSRALVLWGPDEESAGTFAGVELKRSNGFGTNRASSSVSAMAQYEAEIGTSTRLSILGQSYAARFDSAGVVRVDDVEAGRMPCAADPDSQLFCTYDPNQGGASQRHGVHARLVRRLTGATLEQLVFISRRQLRLRENFTGFLTDVPAAGQVQRGDLSEKLYDATVFGLRGSLALRRRWKGLGQELEVGYQARHDAGDSMSRRLRDAGGEPYARDFDVGFGVTNIGLFLAGTLRPVERLILRAGVRADTFAFAIVDRNRPTEDRAGAREPFDARDAFGVAVLPRVSAQWQLAKGLDWVTSFGTGARSSDASALSDGEFAPFSDVRAAESGLLYERSGSEGDGWTLSSRASAYWTRVERALVFDEEAARNVLQGPSNRFGALAHARFVYGGWLDAAASTTYAEAYQPTATDPWWALAAGARLPYIPRWVNRLDASVRRTASIGSQELAWGTGLGLSHIAPRPLPLGKFSDPIFTVDASASARWQAIELGVSAQNLLDARYRQAEFNYASNFADPSLPASLRAARHVAPGAPRMLLVTLTLHLNEVFDSDPHHDVHDDDHHDDAPELGAPEAT